MNPGKAEAIRRAALALGRLEARMRHAGLGREMILVGLVGLRRLGMTAPAAMDTGLSEDEAALRMRVLAGEVAEARVRLVALLAEEPAHPASPKLLGPGRSTPSRWPTSMLDCWRRCPYRGPVRVGSRTPF